MKPPTKLPPNLLVAVIAVLGLANIIGQESDLDTPSVNLESRASSQEFQQDINLVFPWLLGDSQSTFLLGSIAYNDRDNGVYNVSGGLGLGFVFPGDKVGLRARVNGDYTNTANDNQLEQLGLGFDLFTNFGINLIGNWYLASDDSHIINQFTEITSSSRSEFTQFESGLSGGDLKAVVDLPSNILSMPAQVYASAYVYDGEFENDIEGYNAGIIFNPLNGLDVGAEYYEDKEFFGDHWVFQAKVRIPLNRAGFAKNLRNVFSQNKASQNPSVRSAMVSGFDRRNWILTETSAPILTNEEIRTTYTTGVLNTATVNNGFVIRIVDSETGEVLNSAVVSRGSN